MKLDFIPIKTRIVNPPKDEIWDIIDDLPKLENNDIVFITSKILGIHQGRCVPIETTDKKELIKKEASHYLKYTHPSGFDVNLTINENILIPAAGIDASNANGHYIMWPKNVDALCKDIREFLCKKNNIDKLGVISTDSHTMPLRWGVTGITTGLAGVEPLKDIRGEEDLFGRLLRLTKVNQVDALASMAVLLMGENREQTPIVILKNYTNIVFDKNATMESFKIEPEMDLYAPLLKVFEETNE